MRKHIRLKVSEVKVGDVLVKTDNSKWTVSDVRLMKASSNYYILARNGNKLERWEYLKADDLMKKFS